MSESYTYTINNEEGRLDKFLNDQLPDNSRSQIQSWIKDEQVTVNGEPSKANYKVQKDDLIDISVPDPVEIDAKPEDIAIDIVYQDEDVVVVNKPAGLLSVPGKSIKDSVLTRIKAQFPNATGGMIVHRLDMATSGLLMLALNERAHKSLQHQFISKKVSKRYVACIDGIIKQQSGKICLPLRGDFNDRPKQMVCHEHGKYAETHWQVIEQVAGKTKLFLYPITGRTHQLRMHCAHPLGLNMPIIGDSLYGVSAKRLHLHAQYLSFIHPTTKKQLSFEASADF